MFTRPLIHESVKITKCQGANIEFQIRENSTSLKNKCRCIKLAKIKGAKITFSSQSPIYRSAKLKGFTVTEQLPFVEREYPILSLLNVSKT